MRIKFFIYYVLPIILYMGLIFYFSSKPISFDVILKEKGIFIERWILHIIEYAILSLLVYRAIVRSKFKKYCILLSILISCLYGLTDEIHQIFVPERVFDLLDLSFNCVGAILMQVLIKFKKK